MARHSDPAWMTVREYTPSSDPTADVYAVQRHALTGEYRCHCKGYIFSKATPKTCKHIRHYLDHPDTKIDHVVTIQIECNAFGFDLDTLLAHIKALPGVRAARDLDVTSASAVSSAMPMSVPLASPSRSLGVRRLVLT